MSDRGDQYGPPPPVGYYNGRLWAAMVRDMVKHDGVSERHAEALLRERMAAREPLWNKVWNAGQDDG